MKVPHRYAVQVSDTTMFNSITAGRYKIKNPLFWKWATIKMLSQQLITVMIYFKRTIFCYA